MERKRTKLEIIRDILSVIQAKSGKIKPTHILYKSNLSHSMMDLYLKELIQKEFIKEIKLKKSRSYEITSKGLDYLNQYSLIKDFTESFGLSE
jgi:predicted transcriptional regulator